LELQEESTAFYDALAPLFDIMTDWEIRLAGEGPFLQEVLREAGATRVLDVACGSGGHALALARWGYDVTGVDASQAMIALARRKASQAGLDVPFVVSGFAALAGADPEARPYDAVLCLGNSLPHLLAQADLVAALKMMASVLRPAGLFVTQNLNYDQRWVKKPRFFGAQGGVLDGREALVWRFADYDVTAGRIAFHIALFRKAQGTEGAAKWDVEVHTTPQRPLFHADLVSGLADAGFTRVRSYARMALPLEPFDPERSGDLVVVARAGS
jgi:glycine/sarcosine N-methyltransferase